MPELDHDILSAYLNQHLTGADAGVQSFRAAADTWSGTANEAPLRQLADELEASHTRLKKLIEELGYRVSAVRTAASAVTGLLGRINPLNATRSSEGRLTQLELDTLVGAVSAQQMLWETLGELAAVDDRLERAEFDERRALCKDQIRRVRALSAATVLERFTQG